MNAPLKIEAPVLAGTDAAIRFFSLLMEGEREGLWAAHLDDQARCIELARANEAASAPSDVIPWRGVIADARRVGSAGIVTAQALPAEQGIPERSAMNEALALLRTAAEGSDITLLDHLLFAGEKVVSCRRLGLI